MCLEKPTYGNMIGEYSAEEWGAVMDEQCQRLTEGLIHTLKPDIHVWINRIALEYSSYSRRQELLFGVSRYYLMSILTIEDWMEAARLNEEKLAKQMVQDKLLTILQRYRIACVYCLHTDIPHLWNRLTIEEKHSISGTDDPSRSREINSLVLLWSYHMDGRRDEKVTGSRNRLWTYAAQEAVRFGNQPTLMSCWRRLDDRTRENLLIHLASESLKDFGVFGRNVDDFELRERTLFENITQLNLPYYYKKITWFFLSEMTEKQLLLFYMNAFRREEANIRVACDYFNVLDIFFDWPLRDYFLPTMNLLRGKIPKSHFVQRFLSLAVRTIRDEDEEPFPTSIYRRKENDSFDYVSLLLKLWEEMPIEYRKYRFCYYRSDGSESVAERFLMMFVENLSPFQEKYEAFFKQAWHHLTQEERIEVIKANGYYLRRYLLPERLTFVNWLLEENLPNAEVVRFKKHAIEEHSLYCLKKLADNEYKTVEDFMDWALESDAEKTQFKHELLKGVNGGLRFTIYYLLIRREFTDVENIVNFCLSSDEDKRQFKEEAGKETCRLLWKQCAWELIGEILALSFDSEEKKRSFIMELIQSRE